MQNAVAYGLIWTIRFFDRRTQSLWHGCVTSISSRDRADISKLRRSSIIESSYSWILAEVAHRANYLKKTHMVNIRFWKQYRIKSMFSGARQLITDLGPNNVFLMTNPDVAYQRQKLGM